MHKSTELDSHYDDLDEMSTLELLTNINKEDKQVPLIIEQSLLKIEKLIDVASPKINKGGRLFYIGAGTSGRLGIVDASECPPTFGVDDNIVIGLIAGGDSAIRKAVEFAEDDFDLGFKDLQEYNINEKDVVVGIAASGTTPYVVGALTKCQEQGILTSCIVCNTESPLSLVADYPIEIIVGPEFITGSTRMKSGTAQKLILNMISTCIISNNKLIDRGTKMIMQELGLDYKSANDLLDKFGSVRKVIDNYNA
jgi:N-acetylmuramic acid 6-phosphate etherase